jgi:hypothetical protein
LVVGVRQAPLVRLEFAISYITDFCFTNMRR